MQVWRTATRICSRSEDVDAYVHCRDFHMRAQRTAYCDEPRCRETHSIRIYNEVSINAMLSLSACFPPCGSGFVTRTCTACVFYPCDVRCPTGRI